MNAQTTGLDEVVLERISKYSRLAHRGVMCGATMANDCVIRALIFCVDVANDWIIHPLIFYGAMANDCLIRTLTFCIELRKTIAKLIDGLKQHH
jgi:hypothetical protein